jgi:hypothetical protein
MLNKSQEKFKLFKDLQRGISIEKLLFQIERVSVEYNKIETALDFNWQLVPTLE